MREQSLVMRATFFVTSMCVALFLAIVLALHYRSKQDFTTLHSVLPLPSRRLEVLCDSAAELDMNRRSKIVLGHSSTLQACCFFIENETCYLTKSH